MAVVAVPCHEGDFVELHVVDGAGGQGILHVKLRRRSCVLFVDTAGEMPCSWSTYGSHIFSAHKDVLSGGDYDGGKCLVLAHPPMVLAAKAF